jgi:hypothetical protein
MALILRPLHQLRKLGDVGRDAPRLVANDRDMKMRLTTLRCQFIRKSVLLRQGIRVIREHVPKSEV